MSGLTIALVCALAGIAYGLVSIFSITSKPTGNEEMQRIAGAIQEGANAYLKRQYTAISVVGVILFLVVGFGLDWATAIGFSVARPQATSIGSRE